MEDVRVSILMVCRAALDEMGEEKAQGLSWFYKHNVKVEGSDLHGDAVEFEKAA